MIQRIAILFFSLVLGVSASAQLRISGMIEHEGHPLDEVSIKVKLNGETIQTIAANRRGKYSVELDFDKNYILVFTRPFMFPVSIEVDSEVPDKQNSLLEFEVPLNMVMFYRYQGMNEPNEKESIGTISLTGSGEESFSFVPNAQVIEKLKPLHKESLKRESNNAQPIIEASMSVSEQSDPNAEEKTENKIETIKEVLEPKVVQKAPSADFSKSAAQEKRYETIVEARQIELDAAKQDEKRKAGVEKQSAIEEQNYLEESKLLRAEYAALDKAREQALIEARMKKQEATMVPSVNQSALPKPISASAAVLLSHSLNDGVFLFEEIFLVQQGSLRHEYKKSVYNWVLFDLTYYSKDQEEITQNEYESLKKQLDI